MTTVELPSSSSWRTLAACAGKPTAWWFADDAFERSVAVAVCRSCPVRATCLVEALAEEAGTWLPRYGIRGGVTASRRAAIARTSRPVVTVETHRSVAGSEAGWCEEPCELSQRHPPTLN